MQAIYMDVWPEFWTHPLIVQSIEFPRFVRDVEAGNQDWFDDVCNADIVFIDDIGAEEDRFRSGTPTRILGDLLGALEPKFTFITTNIAPAKWSERWDGRVEDRLLRRNATVCNLWEPEHKTQSFTVASAGL
jgi:DNA replication protein DnaC